MDEILDLSQFLTVFSPTLSIEWEAFPQPQELVFKSEIRLKVRKSDIRGL